MHVSELVEVAGLVALNGPQLIVASTPPAHNHLEQYWTSAKCRADEWHRTLKRSDSAALSRDGWLQLRATLDEIFVGELLTRAWGAVLAGRDRRLNLAEGGALAKSVLDAHLEARHRAMALLVHSPNLTTRQATTVNRIRRRSERWTDVLIGGLLNECDVQEYAVDVERAFDFADDLSRRRNTPGGRQAWRLTLVSLRNAFQSGLCPMAANADANARITASILGSFPGELFDSTGVFRSLWMVRLAAITCDAQGLIDELLAPERPRRVGRALRRRNM